MWSKYPPGRTPKKTTRGALPMRTLTLIAVLCSGAAAADVDARFARLRDAAEPVGGLGSFLDKYVGDCASEAMGGTECRQRTAEFRKRASGKKYYMIISEDAASM